MTYTRTQTRTITEARVRYVLDKVEEDLTGLMVRGMLSHATWLSWREDVEYLLVRDGLTLYEFQVETPDGRKRAIRYRVEVDGMVYTDDRSGGLQVYDLPRNSKVCIVIQYRQGKDHLRAEMRRRGWVLGASLVAGHESEDRVFSKDGYGHRRSIVESG